jgi:acetoin utilization deacetylase AcuC-like enzyme
VKIFYSDHLLVPLPDGHRFPMPKYARLHQALLDANLPGACLQPSGLASEADLLRVHTDNYVQRIFQGAMTEKEMRRIGFPWSPMLVVRSRCSVGGTLEACRAALEHGLAVNLAGGTHHAFADHGEGYCVFNDVAVAARAMQAESCLRRLVIIDLDVHQGNGTAAIFAGDQSVFTFSVHGAKNFPFHKERSDLDIALPDGSKDDVFLDAMQRGVGDAIRQAGADLALYIAGADPYQDDRLGRMAVSKAGLLERDRLVFQACQTAGLPVAVVMGGGYARQVEDVVAIHLQTIRLAAERSQSGFQAQPSPGSEFH